jgi:hypothetical protein
MNLHPRPLLVTVTVTVAVIVAVIVAVTGRRVDLALLVVVTLVTLAI